MSETPKDHEIFNCAAEIVREQAVCIEWGATAQRSVELADRRIRDLLGLPQRFAKDREGEL